MSQRPVCVLACVLCAYFFIPWQVHAEIPRMISYQGRVTDSGGTPVTDGSYDMEFRIFDDATDGDQKWESGAVSVQVTNGVFNALLGESPQPLIMLAFDEDYWLQVTFDGVIQSPRQQMVSVGYAYMASGLVPGTQIEEAKYGEVLHIHNLQTSGSAHGIEVRTNSTGGYAVVGRADATSGLTRGVYGRAASSSGRGVMGYNAATTGDARGVHGETASTSGTAVYGWATASSGINYGGYFETNSSSGSGVRGIATATTGETYGVYGRSYSTGSNSRGVYGRSYATSGVTYGVVGRCDSNEGIGVYGSAVNYTTSGTRYGGKFRAYGSPSYAVHAEAMSNSGFARGVQGESNSDEGAGVYGYADANDGTTYGVYGWSNSNAGRGVAGLAYSSTGAAHGVSGRSNSPDGYGVNGFNACTTGNVVGIYGYTYSTEGIAIWGEGGSSNQSGTGVLGRGGLQGGIFHDTDSGAWVGCARMTYKVLGTGSVSFVQNHPNEDDRVIVYASPEGDEVATYTRGSARLKDGEARVSLGETFAWVTNPDIGLTAHLTPRGDAVPLAVVSLSTEELVVRGPADGSDDVVFDFLVYGLRIGFEEASIVQAKHSDAFIPSMEEHRALYANHPDLRRYNALERFKNMRAAMGETEPLDMSSSEILIQSIEEYDPAVHESAGSEVLREEDALVLAPHRQEQQQSSWSGPDTETASEGSTHAEVENAR